MFSLSKTSFFFYLLTFVCLLGCTQEKEPDPQQIITAAITAHGGDNYKQGVISFRLNDSLFRMLRHDDAFVYSRTFTDSTGQRVYDVLSSSGFTRTVNDTEQELSEIESKAYGAALQTSIELALLPYGLNKPEFRKAYLGEVMVNEEPYYKVQVSSEEQGSSTEYVCLFHQRRHVLEYVAVATKGADSEPHFRKGINAREEGGIRFQDYMNFAASEALPLERLDKAFEAGKLERTTDVVLQDIKVEELPQL